MLSERKEATLLHGLPIFPSGGGVAPFLPPSVTLRGNGCPVVTDHRTESILRLASRREGPNCAPPEIRLSVLGSGGAHWRACNSVNDLILAYLR